MKEKQLYERVFDLLDFAGEISYKLVAEDPENINYLMTLIYIEDILDKYGRMLVAGGRFNSEEDKKKFVQFANQEMDSLRKSIRLAVQRVEFDEKLKKRTEKLFDNWKKLPENHPNLNNLS